MQREATGGMMRRLYRDATSGCPRRRCSRDRNPAPLQFKIELKTQFKNTVVLPIWCCALNRLK
jgi:hypothetical protein